jgi:hypothetical protein
VLNQNVEGKEEGLNWDWKMKWAMRLKLWEKKQTEKS